MNELPVLTESELRLLSSRIVKRFRQLPFGTTKEDARQDAVVALLEQEPIYPGGTVARDAWLVTRVTGLMKDSYGKRWRDHYRHPSQSITGELIPADEPCAVDSAVDVAEGIEQLPELHRRVLNYTLAGWTQKEIGAQLDIGQSYVSQLLKAARVKLAELLGDEYAI